MSSASAAGTGQRASHASQAGSTRTTGVCWSMTSLTRMAQALVPGLRHGRSRAFSWYHRLTRAAKVGSDIALPMMSRAGFPLDGRAGRAAAAAPGGRGRMSG